MVLPVPFAVLFLLVRCRGIVGSLRIPSLLYVACLITSASLPALCLLPALGGNGKVFGMMWNLMIP